MGVSFLDMKDGDRARIQALIAKAGRPPKAKTGDSKAVTKKKP
jgi:hypothetical protein